MKSCFCIADLKEKQYIPEIFLHEKRPISPIVAIPSNYLNSTLYNWSLCPDGSYVTGIRATGFDIVHKYALWGKGQYLLKCVDVNQYHTQDLKIGDSFANDGNYLGQECSTFANGLYSTPKIYKSQQCKFMHYVVLLAFEGCISLNPNLKLKFM